MFTGFDDIDPDATPDQIIAYAWQQFTRELAARLGDLEYRRFDFIEVSGTNNTGLLIRFEATTSGRIRCMATDPTHPGADDSQRTAGRYETPELGFHPGKHRYYCDELGPRQLAAATKTVGLLRKTWAIPYPTFLAFADPITVAIPYGYGCGLPPYPSVVRRHIGSMPTIVRPTI